MEYLKKNESTMVFYCGHTKNDPCAYFVKKAGRESCMYAAKTPFIKKRVCQSKVAQINKATIFIKKHLE